MVSLDPAKLEGRLVMAAAVIWILIGIPAMGVLTLISCAENPGEGRELMKGMILIPGACLGVVLVVWLAVN